VAVWRWHGWGFSLMWRSPPGRYQDLILSEEGLITLANQAKKGIIANDFQ
jgi:hypothetical protein